MNMAKRVPFPACAPVRPPLFRWGDGGGHHHGTTLLVRVQCMRRRLRPQGAPRGPHALPHGNVTRLLAVNMNGLR